MPNGLQCVSYYGVPWLSPSSPIEQNLAGTHKPHTRLMVGKYANGLLVISDNYHFPIDSDGSALRLPVIEISRKENQRVILEFTPNFEDRQRAGSDHGLEVYKFQRSLIF